MLRMVFRPTALPSTPTLTINSNTVNAWLNMLLIGVFFHTVVLLSLVGYM